jgi:hypothetical protein
MVFKINNTTKENKKTKQKQKRKRTNHGDNEEKNAKR